jgi:chromate transport protein ChrA
MINLLQPAAEAGTDTAGASAAVSGVLISLPGIFAVLAILQVFLSKRDNKWLGLVLPAIGVITAFVIVFSMVAFTGRTSEGVHEIDQYGNVINSHYVTTTDFDFTTLVMTGLNFLLFNIPTAVLLLIYFACRESVKKRMADESESQNKEIERMSIQDLE